MNIWWIYKLNLWKKPSFDLREFMLNRSRIMCTFSCNKRHILWIFCIQDFAWFPQKSTIRFLNFLKKYCFRIHKSDNYDHGQVSIHTGKHKHHLHNKLSIFFDILIRIFKIKITSMNKWSLFLYKSDESYDKWYGSTIFIQI